MEEALTQLLLADTAIIDLIGKNLAWDTLPQSSPRPAAVLYLVTGVTDYHMAGPSGLVESRVQIDAQGKTKADALAVARAIEAVLSGYSGTVSGVRFGGIFKLMARSDFALTGAETFFTESADYQLFSGLAA